MMFSFILWNSDLQSTFKHVGEKEVASLKPLSENFPGVLTYRLFLFCVYKIKNSH